MVEDPDSRRLVTRGIAGAIYGAVCLSALNTAGIDTSAVVAGLSVTGLTIGFAARDVASNYIAGLLLIVNRPFVSGDFVKIGAGSNSVEGIVESIDMRFVYLRPKAVDPFILMIPNDLVMRSVLVVNDHFEHVAGKASAQSQQYASNSASPLASPASAQQKPLQSQPQAGVPAQKFVGAYRDVVRAAWSELGSMEEYYLRRRYAPELARLGSINEQKILLWLLERPERAHGEKWMRFLEENAGAFPSWVPTAVQAKLEGRGETSE